MSHRRAYGYATAGTRPNAFAYGLFTLFLARKSNQIVGEF